MSAFGRRNGGMAGPRPAFGVARPMQGSGSRPAEPEGGAQFPPLDALAPIDPDSPGGTTPGANAEALQRLADRQAQSGDAGNSRSEGFESSIHKI